MTMADKFLVNSKEIEASGMLEALSQFASENLYTLCIALVLIALIYRCTTMGSTTQTINGSTIGKKATITQDSPQGFWGKRDQQINNTTVLDEADIRQKNPKK